MQHCGVLLNELAEAKDAVSERALSPKGLLRITSSFSFAKIYLAPMLPAFRALYPKLSVQITAANRYPDFIEAGIDVAIRAREQEPDSNIIVRRIGQMRRVLAATPASLPVREGPAAEQVAEVLGVSREVVWRTAHKGREAISRLHTILERSGISVLTPYLPHARVFGTQSDADRLQDLR